MTTEPNSNSDPMTSATRPITPGEIIKLDMSTLQGVEALQRAANILTNSTLVPEIYRRWIVDKEGNRLGENPSGLANCVVALNMSSRLGADVLMVMQNMHVIEGRPSWSSSFIIASINQCGRFTPLRYDLSEKGAEAEVACICKEWLVPKGNRPPQEKTGTLKVFPQSCLAWAIEKATGQRLDGPEVTMKMAAEEGWIQKAGSKWRTMQELMLRYRSASFFGKLYAPELLMGLQTREEVEDIIDGHVVEETVIRSPDAAPRIVNQTGWTVEAMAEFDTLMDEAYQAFKDAGYLFEYQAFSDGWTPKRCKSEAAPIIEELRGTIKTLVNFVPVEKPTGVNPDDKIRKTKAAGSNK